MRDREAPALKAGASFSYLRVNTEPAIPQNRRGIYCAAQGYSLSVSMTRRADYKAKAERCRALAQAARDDGGRKLWADMEQYWLRCDGGLEQPMEITQTAVIDD